MSGGKNPDREVKKAFFLVAILQSLFKEGQFITKMCCDFYDKEQRKKPMLNSVVDMLINLSELIKKF